MDFAVGIMSTADLVLLDSCCFGLSALHDS